MNTVDEAHIDENTRMIDFLTQIIKANKLHESTCIAFSLPKDHAGAFGTFASMSDKLCHCWLDKDNRAEDGNAFATYHIKMEILTQRPFVNRYGAVKDLLEAFPHLSADKFDENYWGETYAIVAVTTQPKGPTKTP